MTTIEQFICAYSPPHSDSDNFHYMQTFLPPKPDLPRPNDYLTLSILNAFLCIFGFIPLICSLQSRDHYYMGQIAESLKKGEQARLSNIITFVLAVSHILFIIGLYLFVGVILVVSKFG